LEPFKAHGLVELPLLKTREEKLDVFQGYWLPGLVPHDKVPNFVKIKNIERNNLGFTGEEQ
jgi:hypothetical protein